MATYPVIAAPGYQFDTVPDLSRIETRERLSQSAVDGFFAIMKKWHLQAEQAGALLGGTPRSTLHKYKTAAGTRSTSTRSQDELMRISYIIGIYKALHILFSHELADEWIKRPNDNPLFGGATPLEYAVKAGIPGLQQIRRLLDAARGGR
jgi:Protein of unknown function (DUF2384)